MLRQLLHDKYEVYSFGKSGYPLSQYLHVSRYVNHHLSPDIIVFNIVHNDFDESILEYNSKGTYFLTVSLTEAGVIENTPVPNYSFLQYDWKKRFLFQSAFVRYFWFNVYEWKRFAAHNNWKTAAYNANINVDTVSARQDAVRIATYYIIGQIRKENKDKRGSSWNVS